MSIFKLCPRGAFYITKSSMLAASVGTLLAAVSAQAAVGPSVDLSNAGATPTDNPAAICTAHAQTVDVTVDATAHYSSNIVGSYGGYSDCYKCGEGPKANSVTACDSSNKRYRTQTKFDRTVTPGALEVLANSVALTNGGGTWTGTILASLTEGSNDVVFTATIAESYSDTETLRATTYGTAALCNSYTSSATQEFATYASEDSDGTETSSPTASYLVDLVPPALSHTLQNNTVAQNGTVFYDFSATGGSADTGFSLTATASPENLSSTDGVFTFDSSAIGIAGPADKTVGLAVGCAPLGEYSSGGELSAVDLCGNGWGTIYSSNSPTFEIDTADGGCSALGVDAVVSAPLLSDNYETVDCFTSQYAGKGKSKVTANPGTVHAGIVVNMPEGVGDCDATATGVQLTISKDPAFDWAMTGKSPAVHVFVGDALGGFFLHSGAPLTEFTGALLDLGAISGGTDNAYNDIDVDLSELDVGCGAGEIPYGWTIYARAHVRFNDTPGAGVEHEFGAWARADDMDEQSNTYTIDENPAAICTNGQYDE